MGLSGRKVKQRIGKDPRNLSWADDANRFGQAYLAKFGWDASKGLGASGEGRMNAIKATQKLDMLGIGMQHQKDPNGIAWRQNRDFENLLRRLNEGTDTVTGPFHKAREEESLKGWGEGGGEQTSTSEAGNPQNMNEDERDGDGDGGDEDEDEVVIAKKEKKKKKKRKTAEALEEEEDPLDKKKRKKRKKVKGDDVHHALPSDDASEPPLAPRCPPPESLTRQKEEPGFVPTTAVTAAPVSIRAPPRTHRARIIAAKRMAASNSTALAEILGIPSTSSASSLSSPYPSTAITPIHTPTPAAEEQEPLTKLTTSSQSVGDYFKAKLSAKAHGEWQPRPTVATGDNASSPTSDGDDYDHRPGLGLDKGASRMLATDELNEEQARGGIGATKSSKFAAMFTTQSQPAADSWEDNAAVSVELVEAHDATDQDDDCRKREKKRAKEERRREKEERRRRKAEAYQLDDAVVDVPVGEASAGRTKKKKRHELGAPDGDTQLPGAGGTEVIRTKKRKGDKDKKSAKHRRPTG